MEKADGDCLDAMALRRLNSSAYVVFVQWRDYITSKVDSLGNLKA